MKFGVYAVTIINECMEKSDLYLKLLAFQNLK